MNVRERRHKEDMAELAALVAELGQDRAERLLDVHRTTITRWINGTTRIPPAALMTLRGAAYGQLPGQTDKAWPGWGFGRDGQLYSPCGRPFHPGDLLGQKYERALIKSQRQTIKELEAKVAKLEAELALVDVAANDRRA